MDKDAIIKKIWEEISKVEDPDLGMGLVELGLVYNVDLSDSADVHIKMTLTSMACPMGPALKSAIEEAARTVPEVNEVSAEIVWSPAWDPREMASEEAQMHLGLI